VWYFGLNEGRCSYPGKHLAAHDDAPESIGTMMAIGNDDPYHTHNAPLLTRAATGLQMAIPAATKARGNPRYDSITSAA
jgi:hypothetical protein